MGYFWIFTKPSTFVLAGRSPCEDKKLQFRALLNLFLSLESLSLSISLSFYLSREHGRSFLGPSSAPRQKKVFLSPFAHFFPRLVPPTNFSAAAAVLQNKVVDRSIDNHIFSQCQEFSSDLKVAPPFGTVKFFEWNLIIFEMGKKKSGHFLGLAF